MQAINFPTSKITPPEDITERGWHTVAGVAKDFRMAMEQTSDPGRCYQLKERIRACLQTLADTDHLLDARWTAILSLIAENTEEK